MRPPTAASPEPIARLRSATNAGTDHQRRENPRRESPPSAVRAVKAEKNPVAADPAGGNRTVETPYRSNGGAADKAFALRTIRESMLDRAKRQALAGAAFIRTDDPAAISPIARSAIAHRGRRIHPEGPKLTIATRTIVVFLQPFELADFDEVLPAGEYEIEAELPARVDGLAPEGWMSNVLVHLHPRASHPGLSRVLTVPLAALDRAIVNDKFTGRPLEDYFLEEMLVDPMIRLVMNADGVSDDDIRGFYSGNPRTADVDAKATRRQGAWWRGEDQDGMLPRPGSPRPGIGE